MTTTSLRWPSTVHSHDTPEPGLADQVASLLWLESNVVLVITGRPGGRTSGFLADLTHAVSQRATVLRIRTPVQPEELVQALAGQLGVPTEHLDPTRTAARVGERLTEAGARKRHVLICEEAQRYPERTLEALRQLSNHPVNIVLCGTRQLLRRLASPSLAAFKQRINYRLDLDAAGFSRHARPLGIGLFLAALAYAATLWWTPQAPPADDVVHPITRHAAAPAGPEADGLHLILERSLKQPPAAD